MNQYLVTFVFISLITACGQHPGTSEKSGDSIKSTHENMETTQQHTTITFKGEAVHTAGKLPAPGTQAADFTLTDVNMTEKTLADFKGKNLILNIFPSINTGVCARSVRKFNEEAAGLQNTTVLCISKDLPFAQKAFCGAEGINNVVMLSDFRNDFGHLYGVQMVDGPFKGLLSRCIVVIDPEGKVIYTEQVPEIGQDPDYANALKAVRS